MSEPEPPFFARMARAFVEEPTLWPVLAVVALTASTFVAALIVLAIQDRSFLAVAALLGVAFLAVEGVRAARHRGHGSVALGLALAVAAVAAVAAAAYLRLAA